VKDKVRTAFLDTNQGFSADRVVADAQLNAAFIESCRRLEIAAPAVEINIALLNLRKAGLLKGLPRSRKTTFTNEEAYRFASEIAARFIEKRDSTTLDRIICDPQLAASLDTIAADISPGFTSLQYRWAALNLRKARALRPEILSHVVTPTHVSLGQVDYISENDLPIEQGLYIFYSSSVTLYVGEGQSIRRRIAKHLDHSDNKNLARWFWSHGFKNVRLEVQILDASVSTKIRKALEAELIASRRPIFNIQGVLTQCRA
jgi:site-specific DNA-methyltransferase (adenine-specific)